MTNNGPGYEGQQVCHLRTMAIMTKTLVATKSDLNDIFPTKILTLLSNSQGLMDMPVVTILIAQYLILHLTWQRSLRQHQLCRPKYYVQTYIQFPRDLTAMADVTVNTRIATLETHFWEFIFSFNLFGTVQSDDFNLVKITWQVSFVLDDPYCFMLCFWLFSLFQEVTDRKAVHLVNGSRVVLWFLARKWSIVIGRHL